MDIEPFIINDINTVAGWLAAEESAAQQGFNSHLDLIIIAGHAVVPGILGVMQLATEINAPLLFTGGTGHSTQLLRQNLRQNPATAHMTFTQSSEAGMLHQIATEIFGIEHSRLHIEENSTNCGQNALFSLELIAIKEISANNILLSQDPLMQKRTRASFEHAQEQCLTHHRFLNWPVFVPQLEEISGKILIKGALSAGSWSLERFIQLLLGEMKRLNDDADGYGPAGKGFIGHIDIPDFVRVAWQRIVSSADICSMIRQ